MWLEWIPLGSCRQPVDRIVKSGRVCRKKLLVREILGSDLDNFSFFSGSVCVLTVKQINFAGVGLVRDPNAPKLAE